MENSKKYSNIEIKSINENGTAFTEVYIDGHKIRGVRSYKLEQKVGDSIPTLTLDLNALNVSVDNPVLLFADGFGEMEIRFKEDVPIPENECETTTNKSKADIDNLKMTVTVGEKETEDKVDEVTIDLKEVLELLKKTSHLVEASRAQIHKEL